MAKKANSKTKEEDLLVVYNLHAEFALCRSHFVFTLCSFAMIGTPFLELEQSPDQMKGSPLNFCSLTEIEQIIILLHVEMTPA